jgi:chorismate-pyruvate lyase
MERRGGAAPKLEPNQATAPQPILGAHMLGLSDIERILLVADGTFSYQLETFVREPIGVEILSNQLLPLSHNAAPLLNRDEGSSAWYRRTLLRGRDSAAAYVYATSLIDDHGLNPDFRAELRNTTSGIGHLLAKYRIATFRELLTYHLDDVAQYAHYLPKFRRSAFLSRTYRIMFEGRPIMVVTENMPRALFACEGMVSCPNDALGPEPCGKLGSCEFRESNPTLGDCA